MIYFKKFLYFFLTDYVLLPYFAIYKRHRLLQKINEYNKRENLYSVREIVLIKRNGETEARTCDVPLDTGPGDDTLTLINLASSWIGLIQE